MSSGGILAAFLARNKMDEAFLERELIKNSKRFSAAFQHLYNKVGVCIPRTFTLALLLFVSSFQVYTCYHFSLTIISSHLVSLLSFLVFSVSHWLSARLSAPCSMLGSLRRGRRERRSSPSMTCCTGTRRRERELNS